MTMPVSDPQLYVQAIRRDRLVACLRADHPLSKKTAALPGDLHDYLSILYDPHRHPGAHKRLLELFRRAGVQIDKFSRASHPTELQSLVKAGGGIALISKGASIESGLMTLPIAGVDCAIDTVFVYNKELHPKTIPSLARILRRRVNIPPIQIGGSSAIPLARTGDEKAKRPPRSEGKFIPRHSKRRFA